MCFTIPRAIHLLGHPYEDLRLHLCLCGTPHNHYRLLHTHGFATKERAPPVGLTREGPQPASDHPSGAGGGGCVCGLLDAHPHLHPGQSAVSQRPGDHRCHGCLLLLRGAGLHQQQPQPHPLRFPG